MLRLCERFGHEHPSDNESMNNSFNKHRIGAYLSAIYYLMTMKHSIKLVRLLFISVVVATGIHCADDCVLNERCAAGQIESLCQAAIPKYYFDKADKKCKEYIWGGCSEIIPFATLVECELECSCK